MNIQATIPHLWTTIFCGNAMSSGLSLFLGKRRGALVV